jgi:hypothetical protein
MSVLAFLKRTVKRSDLLYGLALWMRSQRDLVLWLLRGRPVPPPPIVKQRAVREFGRRFGLRVLVETGTYMGEMLAATAAHFDHLHSIELSEMLHRKAVERFRNQPYIRLHQGDSTSMLPSVLTELRAPSLFWLDAHYSGGVTAMGDAETPIMFELECIFRRGCDQDVVLIDDARCFDGTSGYPTLDELRVYIAEHRPGARITVANDVIAITTTK